MLVIIGLVVAILVLTYQRMAPPKDIRILGIVELCTRLSNTEAPVKLLDIRDASVYLKDHMSEAINIYVGRLPYVTLREFEPNDEIIILAASSKAVKRAARMMRKAGYDPKSYYVYPAARNTRMDIPCDTIAVK